MRCLFSLSLLMIVAFPSFAQADDPLPSWNDGKAKTAIISFVESVTEEGGKGYVPRPQRIAVFDNDGTLWAEQPAYFQAFYAIDIAKAMVKADPTLAGKEPFKTLMQRGAQALAAQGEQAVVQLVMATHAGMTAEQFAASVRDWLDTAKHPTLNRPYTDLVYQPQLELLDYLRAKSFKTFIVSGGGIDFLRVFAEKVYGIPPEQVVGSSLQAKYEMRGGVPTIIKQPKIDMIDDKEGKPVGIHQHIGSRPLFAAGNSDGDLQMLQYTTVVRDAEDRTPRFGLIVHHTDRDREWAYDRESHIGRLSQALDEAERRGWTVVDMRQEWRQVFPIKP